MSAPLLASDANNTQFVGANNPDSALNVRFYKKAVKQPFLSAQQGVPVYHTVVYVKIWMPGNQLNDVDTPAREDHKRRFPQQWAHFQNQDKDGEQAGVPVTQWPMIDVSLAETLRALKFFTVEQIAFASDEQIAKLGMAAGMAPFTFREKAKHYLQVAKDTSALEKERAEKEELKKRIDELEALVKGGKPAAPVERHDEAHAAEISDLAKQYEAKFGKPPHHKMKPETIKSKLLEAA